MNIEEKISRLLNEDFSKVDKNDIVDIITGIKTKSPITQKILRYFTYDGIDGRIIHYDINEIKKQLKKFGLEEDEITEVRDIWVKSMKTIVDSYISSGKIKKEDVMIDYTSFGVYKVMSKSFYSYSNAEKEKLVKLFLAKFNERMKNRKYGKI